MWGGGVLGGPEGRRPTSALTARLRIEIAGLLELADEIDVTLRRAEMSTRGVQQPPKDAMMHAQHKEP